MVSCTHHFIFYSVYNFNEIYYKSNIHFVCQYLCYSKSPEITDESFLAILF